MTPLAKHVWKRVFRPQKGKEFLGAEHARTWLPDAHYFDVSAVVNDADELARRCVNEGTSITDGQFLPFPTTWMEMDQPNGRRKAWVLREVGEGYADLWEIELRGALFLARVPVGGGVAIGDEIPFGSDFLNDRELSGYVFGAYALLSLINSDHTVVTHKERRETAPIARSILKRSRSEGVFPLRGWTEITLVAFHRREIEEVGAGGIARRVCYHWVRKHDRHLRDGRVIIIPAHPRGDKSLGVKQTRYRVLPPNGETVGRGCDQ